MNTTKVNHKNTLMIAHRGLSSCETENTNAAFVAAGNRSYHGIETDVHTTSDGKFVVIHDDSTKRVSETEIPVETSNLSDLERILLKDMNGIPLRSDLKIPQLSEYINICKRYEKICVLELKNTFARSDIENILAVIRECGYLDQMIFISFHEENLIILRELLGNHPLQLLTTTLNDRIWNLLTEYHLDLDIYYEALTRENIQELHTRRIKVNCWTCDDAEAAEQLIEWGVDYITTNSLE